MYFPAFLDPRRRWEMSFVSAVTDAYVLGVSTRSVDGLVRGFRSKPACDPLREPRVRRYDAVIYLGVLADQTGTRRAPGTRT